MGSISLSKWQSLKLTLTLLAIPSYVLPRAILQHFYHQLFKIRSPSQADLIRCHIVRWLGSNLDHEQLRIATQPPTDLQGLLDKHSNLLKVGAEIVEIQEKDFKAFWLPKIPDSDYIILYLHGGGFVSGSTASHAGYIIQMAFELHLRGQACSVLSIDYDLAPEEQYPTPIMQLSAAYRYASKFGKPIILAGDSAGGHLCLALLRHIHTPHPLIQPVGASMVPEMLILISPWVDLRNQGASVKGNAPYDCLDKQTLDRWAGHYLGTLMPFDAYTDPLNSKPSWQEVLPRKTLMLAGEFECFLSEMTDLARVIKSHNYEGLDFFIEPLKCHAWPVLDFSFGMRGREGCGSVEDRDTVLAKKGLRIQVDWIIAQHNLK